LAKLSLSQQILSVIASPSLLVILREPFACCHSERVSRNPERSEGEESDTVQDKLSDRRISSSAHSEVRLTRVNSAKNPVMLRTGSAKQSVGHFWDCFAEFPRCARDKLRNDIWR